MTFGEAIRARREAMGMTQQELAARLYVSRQTVSRWESGSRCPDLIMSKKLAMILGISMDELIPGDALANYVPPKETAIDLSCVKVMLSGIMLVLVGAFLIAADTDNMDISAGCFVLGILAFIIGLCIPWHSKGSPVIREELPQRKCPLCGKEHDFDYPKCPHCDYDYNTSSL